MFCQPDINSLLTLSCILLCFQAVSGLRVNLHKSELVELGTVGNGQTLARVLNCKIAQLPIKYLGVPLGARYEDRKSWDPIIDTVENKFAGWKRNFLFKGGKLTLIKSTLLNLSIYYLSVLHILKKVAKKLVAITKSLPFVEMRSTTGKSTLSNGKISSTLMFLVDWGSDLSPLLIKLY